MMLITSVRNSIGIHSYPDIRGYSLNGVDRYPDIHRYKYIGGLGSGRTSISKKKKKPTQSLILIKIPKKEKAQNKDMKYPRISKIARMDIQSQPWLETTHQYYWYHQMQKYCFDLWMDHSCCWCKYCRRCQGQVQISSWFGFRSQWKCWR